MAQAQAHAQAQAVTMLIPRRCLNNANQVLCSQLHASRNDPVLVDILLRTNSLIQTHESALRVSSVLIHAGFQEDAPDVLTERAVVLPPGDHGSLYLLDRSFRMTHLVP
jgi:hypothetical protein